MNILLNKIKYTISSVNDIQKALEEHGFNMTDLPLEVYGDIIRSIKNNGSTDSSNYNIIFNMLAPKSIPSSVILLTDNLFAINNNNSIADKTGIISFIEKEIIELEDLTIVNSSKNIQNMLNNTIIDKDVIKLNNDTFTLNNPYIIYDMKQPIEEV